MSSLHCNGITFDVNLLFLELKPLALLNHLRSPGGGCTVVVHLVTYVALNAYNKFAPHNSSFWWQKMSHVEHTYGAV